MADSIFRKKSLDRVASPEALNDYVRVASPGVWVVLSAIIVLLLGVCIWGVFGHLDTKLKVGVVHDNNQTKCYITEGLIDQVTEEMVIMVDGVAGSIQSITAKPIQVSEIDAYLAHVAGLENNKWVYEAVCDIDIPDGIYEAEIITDSVSPMSFVIN